MRIAVVQFRSATGDIALNVAGHYNMSRIAVEEGVELILFPELSLTGYEPEQAESLATKPDDSRFIQLQQLADEKALIIGAGIPLRTPGGITISMMIFNPGSPVDLYSKQYLHQDELPYFVAGSDTSKVLQSRKIGLAICYELTVPDHALAAARAGSRLYIASVAKTDVGMREAQIRLRKIAMEHRMPVMCANCTGPCDGSIAAGRSAIWNQEGNLLGMMDERSDGFLWYDTQSMEHKIIYIQ